MGKVLAFINQKGGVGKTTSAVNVGLSLAVSEIKTLIVDLDPQANATIGLSDLTEKSDKNIYDVLINNVQNKGKGNAVKSALEKANGKYVVFQDADLEYDPQDFNKFVNLINKFSPDLIIGSRFNYADYTRSHHFFNKIGNYFITFLFNIIYQTTFTDVYSCYACFKKELLNCSKLKTNGFEQHAEILCKVVKKGKVFFEVPINYNGRTHEDGKKIKFYHIFSVIYQIIIGRFI